MKIDVTRLVKRALPSLLVITFFAAIIGGAGAVITHSEITESVALCPVVNTLTTTEVDMPNSVQVGIKCRPDRETFYVRRSGNELQAPAHGTLYTCRVKMFSSFGSKPELSDVLSCTEPKAT